MMEPSPYLVKFPDQKYHHRQLSEKLGTKHRIGNKISFGVILHATTL